MTFPERARYPIVAALVVATVAGVWLTTHSPASFVLALATTWLGLWIVLGVRSGTALRLFVMRFAAAHLALLVLVGLLELPAIFGIFDYRLVFATPILSPSRDPRCATDPELLYLPRPNDRRAGDDGRGDIAFLFDVPDRERHPYDVASDGRGFRNPVTMERADVAVVGDSFVANDYVPESDDLTEVLANRLGAAVCNLGQRGYGPQQEAAVVRRYALPLHPRVVVWVFFDGNDLDDLVACGRLLAHPAQSRAERHGFAARSFTRNSLESLMFLVGNPRPSALPRSAWWSASGCSERLYFLSPSGPLGEQDRRSLEELRGMLADTAKRCADTGARFAIAFAPVKFRACRDALDFDADAETAGWTLNDLPEHLAVIARGLPGDVEYVDLTPTLAARSAAGELPYFRDDTHWNAAGNRIAAEALAAALKPLLAKPLRSPVPDGTPERPR